jgi:thioredoxin-like negative regulator of GroEL
MMRSALAVLFLLAAFRPAAAQEGGIQWFNDLKQATAAAQRSNLPMFVDFWADWCAACKIMDADVYPHPSVIKAFETKIIGVRIHFDIQQELARKYEVHALPYLVFTNSNGTPLFAYRGLMEVEDLVKVVDAMPPLHEINRLDLALQKNKNHFESLETMANQLRQMGFFQTSSQYFDRAIKTSEARKNPAKREALMMSMGANYLELQAGEEAISVFERMLKEFPKSQNRPDIMLAQAQGYHFSGNEAKTLQILKSIISEYPGSDAARTAQELVNSL